MLKTEAIKNFLADFAPSDLADLYSPDMEVQVNVAQDGGETVQGKSGFTGRMWRGYTDGTQTWKSFRIPWKAASDPEYNDSNLNFCLKEHAEGIGMTGWDWANKVSRWVAYDFDSIAGHSEAHAAKLTAAELNEVQKAACAIPWVTVRKSTAGVGLHLYVFLDAVPTATHTEHAALGRAILGKMSAIAGCDFTGKVDACGGNMWAWARKLVKGVGLELIKQGDTLLDLPVNWKDHLDVIRGKRRKNLPSYVGDDDQDTFDKLTGQRVHVKLDKTHRALLDYLDKKKAQAWWDSDHHLLVCHTADLVDAHRDLQLRGIFTTIAKGREKGADHNAFLTPISSPVGAWKVRRFTPGATETPIWKRDASGWTVCAYNCNPSLPTAAAATGGVEGERGGYNFRHAEDASAALDFLGADVVIPEWAKARETEIIRHKDGHRLIVKIKRASSDLYSDLVGWREDGVWWARILDAHAVTHEATEATEYDDLVRHLLSCDGDDYGWVVRSDGAWHNEPLTHTKIVLKSTGMKEKDINKLLGSCILSGWTLVSLPFQPEFPGDRKWNRDAAQMTFAPQIDEPYRHPTWDKILNHCGAGLDGSVQKNDWCGANGILSGGDYLRSWVASLFQEPTKPLPYLFLYSKQQETGKSTFHEAVSLLISSKGHTVATAALLSQGGFNAEMEHAVLCAVEECDISKGGVAKNRIKDWVTSQTILIHPKGKTPYLAVNTAHFVQTANELSHCPVFPGDSRITVGLVPPLPKGSMIPQDELYAILRKEAPAFMATLLKLEIPKFNSRLNIPVLETEEKEISAQLNRSELEIFIDENVRQAPGYTIPYSEFWVRFQEWLDPSTAHLWTKIRMGRELPPENPKGRLMKAGAQFHVANVSLIEQSVQRAPLVVSNNVLAESKVK